MKRDEPTKVDLETKFESAPGVDTPVAPALPVLLDDLPHDQSLDLLFELKTGGEFIGERIFGEYRLIKKIGQGGTGVVFQAEHRATKDTVAIKILKSELLSNPVVQKRFRKEARLNAEIESPYVTRQIGFGQQGEYFYTVNEFIDGSNLRAIFDYTASHDERHSWLIIRDVLRALVAIHAKGMIHRDVKPDNVLIVCQQSESPEFSIERFQRAKLTDFGLARHAEQTESLEMTRQHAFLGTPLYLSPEQHAESRDVDARADIYSLGVTIYHMLVGQPPFVADELLALAELHRSSQAKLISEVRSDIGGATSSVVAKAMAKEPAMRYASAADMLQDVERILADKPITIPVFPAVSDSDKSKIQKFNFSWDLECSADQLWPLISDTDRFNKAIGLPSPRYDFVKTDADRQLFATAKFNGMKMRWREYPFQWIEGREMSVLREFEAGPFAWVTSKVELAPLSASRTRLTHRFQVKPRGLFGRLITPLQFKWITGKAIDRVYRRIEVLAANLQDPLACDATFGKPVFLTKTQQNRLEVQVDQLCRTSRNTDIVRQLATYLRAAADSSVTRIRPKTLASKLRCSTEDFLELAMQATKSGLLIMMWDVICPSCRIASTTANSIADIKKHQYCPSCDVDFDVDFATAVELIFRVHPEIRDADTKTYCIGGPFHSPHVVAQTTLQSGKRLDIGLVSSECSYLVRGPQLPAVKSILVSPDGEQNQVYVDLFEHLSYPSLRTGFICIQLHNSSTADVVTRVERSVESRDSLTASEISHLPLFQELFPNELRSINDLVEKSKYVFVLVKMFGIDDLIDRHGEVRARAFVADFRESMKEVETLEVDAGFDEPIFGYQRLVDALKACTRSQAYLQSNLTENFSVAYAVHEGEVLVGSRDSKVEVFGKTLRRVREISRSLESNQLLVTSDVAANEEFQEFSVLQLEQLNSEAGDQLMLFKINPNAA